MTRILDDAGFTLLELLIALTLLGFLSLLLFGGLKLGTRVWERSEDVTASGNRIRGVQQLLADQIRRIYPMLGADAQVAFDGHESTLRFLTTTSDNGGLKRVMLLAGSDGDRTTLSEVSNDELARNPGPVRTLLAPIVSLSFAYFGSEKGEQQASWHREWTQQNRLPQLIRVRASMTDRALVFPDLIVAPRLDADQSCSLDPLTHDCQGR
jgi:general secretion pathway protein J